MEEVTQRVLTVTTEGDEQLVGNEEKEFIVEMKQQDSSMLKLNGDESNHLRFIARLLIIVILIPILVVLIL